MVKKKLLYKDIFTFLLVANLISNLILWEKRWFSSFNENRDNLIKK